MTRYENVSVHEYVSGPKEGERFLKFGLGDSSGADLQLPTPNNDIEEMARMERERVMTYSLPEPMTKDKLRDWLEENQPDPVWTALRMDDADAEEAET